MEINEKNSFKFGKNWKNFLSSLNNNKIKEAENSLKEMFEVNDLKNKTFLDAGSGSGLFSLAAKNLGAKVVSFDIDKESVFCSLDLKSKFYKKDNNWKVLQGSILDKKFINLLGKFDYVYSWGVLHHTGNLKQSLEMISNLVKKKVKFLFLFIIIKNI